MVFREICLFLLFIRFKLLNSLLLFTSSLSLKYELQADQSEKLALGLLSPDDAFSIVSINNLIGWFSILTLF